MHFHGWDAETRKLFHAIRRYRKACGRYLAAKPSPEVARARLDQQFDGLLEALNAPSTMRRLHTVIDAGATKAVSPMLGVGGSVSREDLHLELQLAKTLDMRPHRVAKGLEPDAADGTTPVERIDTADDLIARLEDFHEELIERTEEARAIEDRQDKKKRKRNLGQAAVSILFGTGCGVANTYAIPGMPYLATSYAVTLAAFHQAARDIVGEKPKD